MHMRMHMSFGMQEAVRAARLPRACPASIPARRRPAPCRQLRRIQRQVAAEELALLHGSGSAEHGALAAAIDSDDSEAELLAGPAGNKALPKLGAGALAAAHDTPGGAGSVAAAAAALDLLPGEDSGRSAAGASGGPRSMHSTASDGAAALVGEGRVTWGGAMQIPAHHGEAKQGSGGGAGGAAPRPSSARRTTGSGNALLRKAAGGGGGEGGMAGGGANVLVVDGSLRRGSLQPGAYDF